MAASLIKLSREMVKPGVLRKNLALVRSLTSPKINHPLNLYIYIVA